jgi:hypothetical protein
MKNLYLIFQDVVTGHDTYESAVVCAQSEEEASNIHPSCDSGLNLNNLNKQSDYRCWPSSADDVKVVFLGECTNKNYKNGDVICSNFHAG